MHELSIAESILDAVRTELTHRPGARLTRIGLCIGEMAAVDPESLKFCFESIVRGTGWETVQLETRISPARRICIKCSHEFVVKDYNRVCPVCLSELTEANGGDELDFDYLEIETDGTLAAQIQSTQ